MKVKLSDIVIDAGTQARQCISTETVDEYAERMIEGDAFPPVVLFHDGTCYYIGDGFHRVLASERNDFIDIEADVRKGTQQDALWFALGANKTNGQRMSRGDIRHAVEVALKTWPDKTQQAIAEQVGCSQGYVAKVREVIIPGNNHSLPDERVNAQGRTRPTTYKRKDTPDETQSEGETKQEGSTTKKEKARTLPPVSPPSVGIQFASMAIDTLAQIADNDTERQEAFDMVIEWINENNERKQ